MLLCYNGLMVTSYIIVQTSREGTTVISHIRDNHNSVKTSLVEGAEWLIFFPLLDENSKFLFNRLFSLELI